MLYYFHALVVFPVARLNGFVTAELCDFLDFVVLLSGLRTVVSSESLVIAVLPGRLVSSVKCFWVILLLAVTSGSACAGTS